MGPSTGITCSSSYVILRTNESCIGKSSQLSLVIIRCTFLRQNENGFKSRSKTRSELWDSRKYTHRSSPWASGTEFLKPCDFLSDKNTRSTSYSNEASRGGLLEDSLVGAAHQSDHTVTSSFRFLGLQIFQRESRNGFNNQWCLHEEASIKPQYHGVQRASRWAHNPHWEGDAP